jgi:hypothetical protein
MLNGKRSQAALEFLMTYGWAILVVLIVISALAYFGVLNPQRMLPSRCTMPTGFSCQNFVAHQAGNNITLNVINGMGLSVIVTNITLLPQGTNPVCTTLSPTLNNGRETQLTFSCPGLSALSGGDQKYRWDIVMQYYASDSTSTFTKTIKGELLTTLES